MDTNNTVTEAFSSGTMVRGIEKILIGRDPREAWAFAQRACGVCTTVHAFASIRAVEDALNIKIPKAANLIRNLMIAQQYVHDHVMHFYHLHALDFVDVVSSLKADPAQTSSIQKAFQAGQILHLPISAAFSRKFRRLSTAGSYPFSRMATGDIRLINCLPRSTCWQSPITLKRLIGRKMR